MLARALASRLDALGVSHIATDVDMDIGELERLLAFAREHRPTAILNAAAYTRVDDAEANEAVANRVNAEGAGNLARAALEVGARLLHYSTDYVFDGTAQSPYREDAPTAPRSAYGRSKLGGEQRLLATLATAPELGYVVRTSWLFGAGGPNFVKTMVGLMRDKEELRVVQDQHGRPTYTVDLADASLRLLGFGAAAPATPGIYHFANGGPTSWHGFASSILEACRALGLPVKTKQIVPVTTAEFPRPAPRPAYSVLDTTRIEHALGYAPRHYLDTLPDYLTREFAASERPL